MYDVLNSIIYETMYDKPKQQVLKPSVFKYN